MAEQKRSTGTTTRKRATTTKRKPAAKTKKKSDAKGSFTIRKEVKGVIIMAIAVIAFLGIFGMAIGSFGDVLSGIFRYGFGYGGIVPCVVLFYAGFRILYDETGFHITRRGILFSIFFVLLITLVTLTRVPDGQEMQTTNLADQGGVVGGLVAVVLRAAFGSAAIFVDIVAILVMVCVIWKMSMRKGMHKAKEKTEVGLDVAKAVTEEKVQQVKEKYTEWKIERAERRAAYNQEKDTRFDKSAAAEVLAAGARTLAEEKADADADAIAQKRQAEELEQLRRRRDAEEAAARAAAESTAALVDDAPSQDAASHSEPSYASHSEPSYASHSEVSAQDVQPSEASHVEAGNEEAKSNVMPWERPYVEAEATQEASQADHADQQTTHDAGPVALATTDEEPPVEPVEMATMAKEIKDVEKGRFVGPVAHPNVAPPQLSPVSTMPAPTPSRRWAAAAAAAATISDGYDGYDSFSDEHREVPTMNDTSEDTKAVAVTTEGVVVRRIERPYRFPSLNMLSHGKASTVSQEEVTHNVETLESTLKSFGVTAHVVNATKGPAVTRYELEPAPGTKVSKILGLTDDLKLNLAATDIRMEAPIPGKSAIGIEVPNRSISPVHLRDVLESEDFRKARGGIPVGLGKDIAGKAVITDLAKMPHLLVAGSTGSGKSVCVNTLISSILFSRKPEEVKLILIDPKMVELSIYNGIPHLMVPVVTDMKKAAAVLRWAVREMEARYRTMATVGARNISGYNEQHPKTAMPLVLIIIDELADLMITAPDVEEAINRLAAKARAAGIHMVLATQRPSVNVITGTIKANVPSRISFAVATQIDSRTILDMAGAEKLLGKGDMLFNPIGANKPIRIQGAFISDEEVEDLVNFVKAQGQPEYDESVINETEAETEEVHEASDEPRDEYLERAVDLVMESGQASVSMLQRRFRIGYTRAARLVDTMEEMKIVGPSNGSKARDILMSREQVKALYFNDSK